MANRNHYTYTPGYGTNAKPPRAQQAGVGYHAAQPQPGPARRPVEQAAARRPAGDTVVLTMLFIVAPLCGLLGVFIKAFLWVFVGVTLLVLAAMWALRCFEQRGRAFLSGVLLVLAAVALIAVIDLTPKEGYFPTYGNDPVLAESGGGGGGTPTGTQNNPAFLGLGDSNPQPTAPIDVLGASEQTAEGDATLAQQEGTANLATGVEGVLPGAQQPKLFTSEAETALNNYMQLWKETNFADMVRLTTPEWRAAQTVPQRQLSWAHSGWILNDWEIQSEAQSPSADAMMLTVYANLTKNSASKTNLTHKFDAIVINKDGEWLVDADSMRTGVEVKATEQPGVAGADPTPTPQPTTDPSLKLWYNTNGGSYYHLEEKCSEINEKFYKSMESFSYSQLGESKYSSLQPCSACRAPKK